MKRCGWLYRPSRSFFLGNSKVTYHIKFCTILPQPCLEPFVLVQRWVVVFHRMSRYIIAAVYLPVPGTCTGRIIAWSVHCFWLVFLFWSQLRLLPRVWYLCSRRNPVKSEQLTNNKQGLFPDLRIVTLPFLSFLQQLNRTRFELEPFRWTVFEEGWIVFSPYTVISIRGGSNNDRVIFHTISTVLVDVIGMVQMS